MAASTWLPLRHRPDRAALDKLRLDVALAAVVLAVIHMIEPAQDTAHDRREIPFETGNLRLAPGKSEIVIHANERDIPGSDNPALCKMIPGSVKLLGLDNL